jgi:succinate-acetate transporter protein
MNDLETNGNYIEAAVWFVVSLILLVKCLKSSGRLRRIFCFLSATFCIFAISDLIESKTGAWWRPTWLLIIKISCVLSFIVGFWVYYRISNSKDT